MVSVPAHLAALARLYGVHTSYVDMHKRRKHASPEALEAVLHALGADKKNRRHNPVKIEWDGRRPIGYHYERDTLIISAPTRANFPFQSKQWGVFAPVYALHSQRHPNAGTLTEFESVMTWIEGLGGTIAATLPLLAAFLDKPFEPSPYVPVSRLFWNEFFVDVDEEPRHRGSGLVDYRSDMRRRRRVLEEDAKAFYANYSRVPNQDADLERYARFRAITEKHGVGWRQWPDESFDEEVYRYHIYAQWRAQQQLQTLSEKADRARQTLYLDLPLGIHGDGYDTWRYRDLFVDGLTVGAPPDPVFTTGQNWNFPPMHPQVMRERHYEYTIAYIRNHLRFAKMLRIDHVMGLHRLFCIPKGFPGSEGVYIKYPAEELYAILSVESHLHNAGIVGENLGIVPKEVTASMRRHNILEMYVAQYEVICGEKNRGLRPVPRNAVASVNTHDMAPFRAFFDGLDIDDRIDLGFLDPADARAERRSRALIRKTLIDTLRCGRKAEDVYQAILSVLEKSKARIVLVNLEDLWQETKPQNVPATTTQRPNWRRRMRHSTDSIRRRSSQFPRLR